MIPNFKNLKNKMKFISLIKIVIFIVFSFYSFTSFARGGGGGSSSGGSGVFSVHSSSQNSIPFSFGNILYIFICICIFLVIIFYKWSIKNKKIKQANAILKSAELSDGSWSNDLLKNRVSEIFLKFQKDWSHFNSDSMKEYLTPDYYKRIVLEMNILKNENRKNIMKDVAILNLNFLEIHDENDNNKDGFTIEVNAVASDSLYDTMNDHLLYTDSSPFTEYWDFKRYGDDWKLDLIKQSTEDIGSINQDIVDFSKRNNFYYDPDFGWLMMPNKGVIFNKNNFTTSDINNHVVGYFKEKIVEFYTYIPNIRNRGQKNYIVAQVVLPVKYNDILVRRKKSFLNIGPFGMKRIKTESNDFERKFCLWAHPSDRINSFELLSPDFMERVYDLPFELNIEIVGNFLYFYTQDNSFVNYDKMLEIISWAFDEMKM